MLTHLFEYLDRIMDLPGSGLFRYITFRAGMAIILSLLISMVFGSTIIRKLRSLQIGESVRDLGLQGQKEKEGTPTMGGIIIVLAVAIPCLLMARLNNVYIQLMLLSTIWMATIGFLDDYIKVFRKNKAGLKAIFKIIGQIGLGLIVGLVMLYHDGVTVRLPLEQAQKEGYQIVKTQRVYDDQSDGIISYAHVKTTLTNVPFMKGNQLDYSRFLWFLGDNASTWAWIIFIPLIILIVTAVSNAANLTDGLDGLATGISGIIAATLGIMAYLSSNAVFARYLDIFFLPDSAELVIFAACLVGACVGFLWYNAYPAQVFMGDTGSLTLGGMIAALAIVLRKELLIPVLCGIFLIENVSVILQVSYFKYTRKKYGEGRRIFLMSPLHHHYQKKGWHEAKIVARFWIVGILLAVFSVITLKIR
ncbi:MAG: phospho-N-acetylmuramoyl-pentapeptide-transferase [Saprospiraceae bacterium]|nr:phospho-N-acetylmuramoyl-pentapeptide-transferase [Saprospiraceae bacterium]